MEAETVAICPYLPQREQRQDDGEMSRWHDVVTVDDSTKSTLLARSDGTHRARTRPRALSRFVRRPSCIMQRRIARVASRRVPSAARAIVDLRYSYIRYRLIDRARRPIITRQRGRGRAPTSLFTRVEMSAPSAAAVVGQHRTPVPVDQRSALINPSGCRFDPHAA